MKYLALSLIFLASDASAFLVMGPQGAVDVQQNADGFTVYGLSGQGITQVMRTGSGYSVLGPQGITNIYMAPGESEEVRPAPTIPLMGDFPVGVTPRLGD